MIGAVSEHRFRACVALVLMGALAGCCHTAATSRDAPAGTGRARRASSKLTRTDASTCDTGATGPLGENELRSFVYRWFSWLDRQVDEARFLQHLPAEGFVMRFPEATLGTPAEFVRWYAKVRRNIPQNRHVVERLALEQRPDKTAEVSLVVRWIARTASDQSIDQRYAQTWRVTRDARGCEVIHAYLVTSL